MPVTPAKRQREASSPASISSDDAASTYDEYDDMPYVAWTHSGNIKVQGGWDTIFEPLARELEDKSGHIQFFEASGDDFDPDVTELRFVPPSQDVLLRLARPA